MKQEHKELLLKDLCARLPYGVKCTYFNTKDEIKVGELLTVWCKEKRVFIDKLSIDYDGSDCIGVIPYLFPLSSITEEQEKELSKLGVSYCEYALHDDIRGLGIMVDEAYIFFEFCYKHHIDFLGLIKLGLAIDATNLNIY